MSYRKKFKVQNRLALLMTVVGVTLAIFMIVIEDEPGALPLLMIIIGASWYIIIRSKLRSFE